MIFSDIVLCLLITPNSIKYKVCKLIIVNFKATHLHTNDENL